MVTPILGCVSSEWVLIAVDTDRARGVVIGYFGQCHVREFSLNDIQVKQEVVLILTRLVRLHLVEQVLVQGEMNESEGVCLFSILNQRAKDREYGIFEWCTCWTEVLQVGVPRKSSSELWPGKWPGASRYDCECFIS